MVESLLQFRAIGSLTFYRAMDAADFGNVHFRLFDKSPWERGSMEPAAAHQPTAFSSNLLTNFVSSNLLIVPRDL